MTVRDVTDAEFDDAVIERSREVPVVVDFWATWCAPCRQLSPIIERVADEHAGDVDLLKMDVDANPQTSAIFGIKSIPTVIAFKGGVPVDGFIGAHPETAVREFFSAIGPSEADRLVAKAKTLSDDDAEALLREALAMEPDNAGGITSLARLLSARGEADEARALLARIPETDETRRILAELDLSAASGADLDALRAKAEASPDDPAAKLEFGKALAARAEHAAALEQLLEAVRLGEKERGREAILDVFAVLGDDDPLVARYRPALANALF